MTLHWLDADILIQAKNAYYAFDIAPGFWDALKKGARDGIVRSPMMVHDEIMKGGDELTKWAKLARTLDLFQEADQKVQAGVGKIGKYVEDNFEDVHAKLFLEGADPWVISAALVSEGTVVTHETLGGVGCKKVKIPNICKKFDVEYINSYELLRRLGRKLR